MTTAEVLKTPRPSVVPTYINYGADNLNVTDGAPKQQEVAMYTAAELLEAVLGAYERGYDAGRAQTARDHWNSPAVIEPLREARTAADVHRMKSNAQDRYQVRGLSSGYDYRGGPVDWATGMPAGSACGWLRRTQRNVDRMVA